MSDNSSIRTDVSTIHLDNISLQNRDNIDSTSKYLGFDLSTQQLKAIVIDDNLKVCHRIGVSFDEELGEYKTHGGVYKSEYETNRVTAPVNMWLKALDMCLDKLKIDGLDFSTVCCISGCAQQHGSVWWKTNSSQLLANLNPDDYLHKALAEAFTLRDSPVWMDSSTEEECTMMERLVGGPERMAELTGSRAYERFTGPQIAKIYKHKKEVYQSTERISLISSFLSSVLCGCYTATDASDASGMNMMNLKTKRWSDECLAAVLGGDKQEVGELRAKLGCLESTLDENIVDTHEIVGRLARYFVERYGFPGECLVSSFTGDNSASVAGLGVNRDELVISMGTSDTAIFWLDEPVVRTNGHVIRNSVHTSSYLGLICFKNGSKTRERIRDSSGCKNWEEFSELLSSVPRGNFGNIGFYFDHREIYPLCIGDFRFNSSSQRVESFSKEIEIRACLEGQFMRLYQHSQSLGLDMKKIRRVLVTGGASTNQAILQVLADVFHSSVYTLDLADSACLGAAFLAKYAYELERIKLDQSFEKLSDANEISSIIFSEMLLACSGENDRNLTKATDPTPVGSSDAYETLIRRYVELEEQISLAE